MLQLIFALAIISVLAAMVILGVRSTRASMRLNAAARSFAQNLEKARLNAIRHHSTASIAFVSTTAYQVQSLADDGVTWQTRQYNFDSSISLLPDAGTVATDYSVGFDWRGRTSQCSTLFKLQNDRGDQATVQVGGSGDVTVNNAINSTPNINYANINENANVVSAATLSGSSTKLNVDPCNSSGGTTPIPPPNVTCSGYTWGLNYGSVSVRKNGLSTYSITATVPAAGTITTSPDPNLSVSPPSKTFSAGGGTQSFIVSSVTKTKGTFPIYFYFTCSTPAVLYVTVTN
jgi:type II secretory pathway pseudopilin PulG